MRERNLLPRLAAHLFACSDATTGRTPSERDLAGDFSVSRGRIREALAILEALRFVERRAKSGIYLTAGDASVEAMTLLAGAGVPLDPVRLSEWAELRKVHEVKSAELACSRATAENHQRIREILRASEQRLADGAGLAAEDRDFHMEIVRATGNGVLHRLFRVNYGLLDHRLPAYFADAGRSQRSHAEHLQIFLALEKRDANLAQALMGAHLQGEEVCLADLAQSVAGQATGVIKSS